MQLLRSRLQTKVYTMPSNLHAPAGSSKALRLSFGDEQYVCFHDFKSSDLDSALGLIEHVTESA